MARQRTLRSHRSIWGLFGRIAAGTLGLAMMLAAGAWLSTQLFMSRELSPSQKTSQGQHQSFLEYTLTAKAGYLRVDGAANFPNGIILLGTLDKVGSGPIEVKEALVMNRLFTLEFGPELSIQYYLLGLQDALQAGVYRLSVEFDPAQQSPFAQESLLRWTQSRSSPLPGNSAQGMDPAIIRVSKTFTIGTLDEQQEVLARENEHRQVIRRHLNETFGALTNLWQRLRSHYQQERLRGGFSRTDPRGDEWRTWTTQWRNELTAVAEKGRLIDIVSPASPLLGARDALMNGHKQLVILSDFYFEVLTNERAVTDMDLQRAEQVVQYAFADVSAQLGQPEATAPPVKAEDVKPTAIVTSPLVNIRSRPGMSHEVITHAKKDDVLDLLGEQGEWFQIQLSGGHTGWVHRNVVTRLPQTEGLTGEMKRLDAKPLAPERISPLHLEPIKPLAMPIASIPRPTPDELKIYAELEVQLRGLQARSADERKASEQHVLQRTSEKFGISQELIWNTYLKVQGWEIKQ